jgi:hypothetical protein
MGGAQLQKLFHHVIERIVRAAAGDKVVASGYFPGLATSIYEFKVKCVARDLITFQGQAGRGGSPMMRAAGRVNQFRAARREPMTRSNPFRL